MAAAVCAWSTEARGRSWSGRQPPNSAATAARCSPSHPDSSCRSTGGYRAPERGAKPAGIACLPCALVAECRRRRRGNRLKRSDSSCSLGRAAAGSGTWASGARRAAGSPDCHGEAADRREACLCLPVLASCCRLGQRFLKLYLVFFLDKLKMLVSVHSIDDCLNSFLFLIL